MKRKITDKILQNYKKYLFEEEKSQATINKYMCDLRKIQNYADGREITKALMIEYKEYLWNDGRYKTRSINSFLVAANCLFEYLGWYDLRVKTYKIQREVFVPEERELSKEEYKQLVQAGISLGREKIALIIETLCATGLRVSELSAVTAAGVRSGIVTIYNKGKERQVLIPRDLQKKLFYYMGKQGIKHGVLFRTATGKAVDRTWIWREMKKLCGETGVDETKVFPHNLRHLFARTFYQMGRDIAKLADVLGHSSIDTTRIYLKESGAEHRKQLECMGLVIET